MPKFKFIYIAQELDTVNNISQLLLETDHDFVVRYTIIIMTYLNCG